LPQDGLQRLSLCSSDEGIDIGSGDAHGLRLVGAESWNRVFSCVLLQSLVVAQGNVGTFLAGKL
jgi:hypothetical protein